jgi:Carboxypeptidase regulatory-like domain
VSRTSPRRYDFGRDEGRACSLVQIAVLYKASMLRTMPRHALSVAACRSFAMVAKLGVVGVALWLSACGRRAVQTQPTPNLVSVRGTVFDSLARTPLSGARITFSAADSAAVAVAGATTDSNGTFAISLSSGTWLMKVEHARFDSLRVSLPPRRVEVPRQPAFTLTVGTPSTGTMTRALCGSSARNDDVALVGIVRNAATHTGLDSVSVFVKWVDLTLTARGVTRSTETHVTRTTSDGWYVSCGVPADAELLSWAERDGATTGAVLSTSTRAPGRLDLTLDTTAHPSTGPLGLDPDSSGAALFPTSAGNARYRVLVRDAAGHPVTNARVRLLGRNTSRSGADGLVTFDSIASGTQTLEVLSIGYRPERRTVDVAVGGEPTDTVVLASLKAVLDTVRITASRDATGFEVRRATRKGQFITAADVASENPINTTHLLRTRPGLRYSFDRNRLGFIEVTTLDKRCRPLILVDGFPPGAAPPAPGEAALDWIVHPDEIGGVEIYTTPGQVPAEFARFSMAPCAAIVFWTRERLGLPSAKPMQR